MPTDTLYVIGSGGHAKVVLDALELLSGEKIVVIDGDPQRVGGVCLDHMISPYPPQEGFSGARFHIAIGDCETRQRLHEACVLEGGLPVEIAHPKASIARSGRVGSGSFVAASAVIAADATIGRSAIINHGAIVDHDCTVGDFSHIAPNATLGGGVTIGALVLIGAGATVLPNVRIGTGAVIAAGSTIVRDVAANETVIFSLNRKK